MVPSSERSTCVEIGCRRIGASEHRTVENVIAHKRMRMGKGRGLVDEDKAMSSPLDGLLYFILILQPDCRPPAAPAIAAHFLHRRHFEPSLNVTVLTGRSARLDESWLRAPPEPANVMGSPGNSWRRLTISASLHVQQLPCTAATAAPCPATPPDRGICQGLPRYVTTW